MPFSITPMALAAMTVMLWIIWSDSLRRRRVSKIHYTFRSILYLLMSAALVYNAMNASFQLSLGTVLLVIVTVAVGVGGAFFFLRKAWGRQPPG